MFNLDNILLYTNTNIQIIGVFVAIIGGLIVTKLLNVKVEKDTLDEKKEKLIKEIDFYETKMIKDKEELYTIKRNNYIYYIYDKIKNHGFNIEDYEDYNLSLEERKLIIEELNDMFDDAKEMFKNEHYIEDIDKILKGNHIQEGTIKYYIYEYVGKKTRKRKVNSLGVIDPTDLWLESPKSSSFFENLKEQDLLSDISVADDKLKWKLMEKNDIEIRINGINKSLNNKYDVNIFIFITIFSIMIPQIIISIHPLFIDFKWLKYPFGIYSIVSFVISMILMLKYIYNLFAGTYKE